MRNTQACFLLLGVVALATGAACGQTGVAATTGGPETGGDGPATTSTSTSAGGAGPSTGPSTTGSGGAAGTGGGAVNGTCSVTHTGTSGVAIQGTLLTSTGISQGEVFVDSTGKIACVGPSCSSTSGYSTATIIACAGPVISPGLINAHDHTEYNTAAPIPTGTTRWDHRNGWRKGTGNEPKLTEPQPTDDPATLAAAELRFVLGGATSIIGSGGVHGLLRNLAAYPDTTLTEGLAGDTVYFDTFPMNDSSGTEASSGCNYTGHTTSGSAFSGGAYAPHIAEGINTAAENEFTCAQGSYGLVNAQTAIIHGVGLNATDIAKIAATQAKLIWSPRSNMDLYGNTAEIPVFKALGVTIALGTDWMASGSMNMLRELQCADSLNSTYFGHALTDEDLFLAATWHAAQAAAYQHEIGDLATGLWGDVAIFAGATSDYRAVIDAGVEDVLLVLRAGKPLYGDAALVGALATGCEALPLCGASKSVCVDTPGVTLAQVESASSFYPLYFCKGTTPTNEPSCVPYRTEYASGVTGTDADGDGIPDAMDDCPSVFNPVRPMDGTTQADVDADSFGDACDAKPTDGTAH
ncbi:MAG TPA: amidohydrolase family protein [Byssovorax sp.]|jgi:cytosine/adenosine deaminase-related metal-dependent hydrolase